MGNDGIKFGKLVDPCVVDVFQLTNSRGAVLACFVVSPTPYPSLYPSLGSVSFS